LFRRNDAAPAMSLVHRQIMAAAFDSPALGEASKHEDPEGDREDDE
jgi:hypothetical protein